MASVRSRHGGGDVPSVPAFFCAELSLSVTLREIILRRIEQTLRREVEGADVADALDLKSDDELLAWHDRIQQLSFQRRNYRVDRPGE